MDTPKEIQEKIDEAEASGWTDMVWFRNGRIEGRCPKLGYITNYCTVTPRKKNK